MRWRVYVGAVSLKRSFVLRWPETRLWRFAEAMWRRASPAASLPSPLVPLLGPLFIQDLAAFLSQVPRRLASTQYLLPRCSRERHRQRYAHRRRIWDLQAVRLSNR